MDRTAIFTDGPLILLSVLVAASVANSPVPAARHHGGGSALPREDGRRLLLDPPDFNAEPGAPSGSLLRGVITNLLNPNAYVFWFVIGGPLMASVVQEEWLAPVAYALSFLLMLMLTKAVVAYAVHKASNGISETVYKRLLAGCGVVMLGFSAFYVRGSCFGCSSLLNLMFQVHARFRGGMSSLGPTR